MMPARTLSASCFRNPGRSSSLRTSLKFGMPTSSMVNLPIVTPARLEPPLLGVGEGDRRPLVSASRVPAAEQRVAAVFFELGMQVRGDLVFVENAVGTVPV